MDPIYAQSHIAEGLLFLAISLFLYWRLSKRDHALRLTKLTMYVFLTMGLFFATIGIALMLPAWGIIAGPAVAGAIAIPHLFLFGSMAYIWKFITVFLFPDWEKYYKVFWGLGAIAVLVGIGILTGMLPPVAGKVIGSSPMPFGILIAAIGFYSAWQIGGADGQKLAIFSLASFLALFVSSLLNNAHQIGMIGNMPPILNNLLYAVVFLAAVFYGQIKGVKW